MGNKLTRKSDKEGGWNPKLGCDHLDDSAKLLKIKWKTVPMTNEEAKCVYRRMSTLTGNCVVEGTTGLKKSKSVRTHDCIEVIPTFPIRFKTIHIV